MYEYFRRAEGAVYHVAQPFSHLPVPERNRGRALCGFAVAVRFDSTMDLNNKVHTLCLKCLARLNEMELAQ